MNDLFPLKGSITYELIDEAHKRLLRIAIEVRNVLERHGIPYSLVFGTVIGAVRHKGFIPWDMDMDFGTFDDYDKTVAILKKELPSWLVVLDHTEDPNYLASWVKIVDRYSEFHATMFEGDNKFKYRGLHVDLYHIKKTTYNSYPEYKKQEALDYYERKYDAGLLTEKQLEDYKKTVENAYQQDLQGRVKLAEDKPEYAFLKFFEGDVDSIFPLKPYVFEGEKFMGPNNHDKYLKGCYYKGDYMQFPPYEQRDMKIDELIIKPINC